MADIFEYWSNVGPDEFVHPADRDVLSRVKHPFDLKCLPSCVWGRLRTAPIVLLYLSPGRSKRDRVTARSKESRERYVQRRDGRLALTRSKLDIKRPGIQWLESRTKFIGLEHELINEHVAILNIGAYHSKTLADPSILAALPSSRVTLDWAQSVLFPEAISGQRIVICMRAARFWGLWAGNMGKRVGKGLYVPIVTRGGFLARKPLRDEIITAVRRKIEEAHD